MGIPSYLRLILEQVRGVHDSTIPPNIGFLGIDFNAFIHSIASRLNSTHGDLLTADFEEHLINAVIEDFIQLINMYRPKKTLIAFDGVPPAMKMVQQAARRYKSQLLTDYEYKLTVSRGLPSPPPRWDKTNISPGTAFMCNLYIRLLQRVSENRATDALFPMTDIEYYLSSSNVPHEGEHKIMHWLRDAYATGALSETDNVFILSPDADMIVLSIAMEKRNLFILRTPTGDTPYETQLRAANVPYYYIKIDVIRSHLYSKLTEEVGQDAGQSGTGRTAAAAAAATAAVASMIDASRIFADYTFLTFLCGNDFVIAVKYLKLKYNLGGRNLMGLDLLINIYNTILRNRFSPTEMLDNIYLTRHNTVTNTRTINLEFFRELLTQVGSREPELMAQLHSKLMRQLTSRYGKNMEEEWQRNRDKYGGNRVRFEVDQYQHTPFYDRAHPDYLKYVDVFRGIDFGPGHFQLGRQAYYLRLFGIDITTEAGRVALDNICMSYMMSLLFTMNYYYGDVPTWTWTYAYDAPPLLFDFSFYVSNQTQDAVDSIRFERGAPLDPFYQLMLILPASTAETMLPRQFAERMRAREDLFPTRFDLGVYMGEKFIYSEPLLPHIDADRMREVGALYAGLQRHLTTEQETRNTLATSYDMIKLERAV